MKQLTSTDQADALGDEQGVVLVYKHSTTCPISAAAHGHVQRFTREHPDVPAYMVDVTANRDVSRHLSRSTAIDHESPQAILFRDGQPEWHASHFDITADVLEKQVQALRDDASSS